VATLWGALAQTQFNLAELQALGADVSLGSRFQTIWQDVIGFGPLYALVVAAAFGLAFPIAGWLARRWTALRGFWFVLAGFTALIAAIRLVDALTPPPVLIAATRSHLGLLVLASGGALAGWIYVRLARRARHPWS
jgi:hypothetical protein